MTIGFIHPRKAFLPEIDAYQHFFSSHNIKTIVAEPDEIKNIRADVEWHFMGRDNKKNKEVIKIHEYASASVAPFSKSKDKIKKIINSKPLFRIFNNEYVKKQFHFNDGVPCGIRNYGIYLQEQPSAHPPKKYDFIYVGTVEKKRKLNKLFDAFESGELKNHSLLVLSSNYETVKKKLKKSANIFFAGPVKPNEVYSWINRSSYGINFIPDELPFNQQTSAKLLDYLNCTIPVVSTDYAWVKKFQKEYGGNYFYLNKDLSNFTWKEVAGFDYSFPDLSAWTWEKQIRESGVLEFLQSKFPELSF